VENVSDFKPFQSLSLPDLGDIRCEGLIVIVGPNSSGKSQLLQDMYLRLTGSPRTLVVATDIQLNKLDYEPFLTCLEKEGFLRTYTEQNGNKQFIPLTTHLGTGQQIQPVQINEAQSWYNSYNSDFNSGYIYDQKRTRHIDFLNHFGKLLVSGLFLDRRLLYVGSIGIIDFDTQAPQQDLHAFHVNDAARAALADEILNSFGRAVWSDLSRGTVLSLRVSDGRMPAPDDRLSFREMAKYRTIETEGDGLKSYVAICIAVLLGRRPITLIDEPEMCLHPPQAYNLGRFIGSHTSSSKAATFVSTHSSYFLRGVIQSTRRLQIVRLTRKNDRFSAHLIPAQVLNETLSKPTLRAEAILDGIFSRCVIIVEADSDRLVYHTTLETLASEVRLDVHFAAVGGAGGIAGTCELYRKLRFAFAVIADLDMVVDSDRLWNTVYALTDNDNAQRLAKRAKEVAEKILKLPPSIEEEEVKSHIAEISRMNTDWSQDDDIALRDKLRALSNRLDRMRRLKRGGIRSLPDSLASELTTLVAALAQIGLFLVPVGELEQWLRDDGLSVSTRNKSIWASQAAIFIQNRGASSRGIWDFIRKVAAYLDSSI
jgi:hypothetical protein